MFIFHKVTMIIKLATVVWFLLIAFVFVHDFVILLNEMGMRQSFISEIQFAQMPKY